MNLLCPSPDPAECAFAINSIRSSKLCIEAFQMLAGAVRSAASEWQWGLTPDDIPPNLYRASHPDHPVTKWVAAGPSNASWTMRHAYSLIKVNQYLNYSTASASEQYAMLVPIIAHVRNSRPSPDTPCPAPVNFQNSARHQQFGLDFTSDPVHTAYQSYMHQRWYLDILRTGKPIRWAIRAPDWADPELVTLNTRTTVYSTALPHLIAFARENCIAARPSHIPPPSATIAPRPAGQPLKFTINGAKIP